MLSTGLCKCTKLQFTHVLMTTCRSDTPKTTKVMNGEKAAPRQCFRRTYLISLELFYLYNDQIRQETNNTCGEGRIFRGKPRPHGKGRWVFLIYQIGRGNTYGGLVYWGSFTPLPKGRSHSAPLFWSFSLSLPRHHLTQNAHITPVGRGEYFGASLLSHASHRRYRIPRGTP